MLDFDGSYGLGVLTDGYFPMNAFIGGWVLLAIVAASMSTGDGAILAMSTVWSHNLCRKLPVRRAQCRRGPSSARYGARSARKEYPRWPFKVPVTARGVPVKSAPDGRSKCPARLPLHGLGWQVHHLGWPRMASDGLSDGANYPSDGR